MPRTKLTKNAKRNRDGLEERLKEFDCTSQLVLNNVEANFEDCIQTLEDEIKLFKCEIPIAILSMNLMEFIKMDVATYSEFNEFIKNRNNAVLNSSSGRKKSHDDGYLTEDSTKSTRSSNQSAYPSHTLIGRTPDARQKIIGLTPDVRRNKIGRTPGPLQSAKAKLRRSRSACDSANLFTSKLPSQNRSSRSQIRNLTINPRPKAQSADRAASVTPKISSTNSPPAICRWPRPGELVISLSGSPVVAQSSVDTVANVNIPIKNGLLSLRPKKMNELNEIAKQLAPETLEQMRILCSNMNQIFQQKEKNNLIE